MDLSERQKFDAHEASGLLPRFRRFVQSFCAPIWWEAGRQRVLANGSMCVVSTPLAVFGVTNDHVLRIYEKHKAVNADVFCQLGSGPFEPVETLVDRSQFWDLATFRVPSLTLEHWGYQVWRAATWPPRPMQTGEGIVLGGYPENRRSTDSGPNPKKLHTDFVSFISIAENWSNEHMSFCFDSSSWYWPQRSELPSHPNLSGMSGGPCFRMIQEENRIELAGFVYEAESGYELIRVRQASVILADGHIVPAPMGTTRRLPEPTS